MRPHPISLILGVLAVALSTVPAHGQSQSLDSYALFATDQLRTRGMTVHAGDVGVNLGSLSGSGVISASNSTIAANDAKLKAGSSCAALFAGVLNGPACGPHTLFTGPIIDGDVAETCGFPNPFPSCNSASRVTVAAGASQVLHPGSYGDVTVMGAGSSSGTLILTGGDYQFCSVKLSRGARLLFDSASQVFVQADLRLAPSAQAVPAPGSGILPPEIRWFINGTRIRPSRGATLDGKLCGPRATLGAAAGSTLDGSFVVKKIRTDRTEVNHNGFGPTTTTTSITTTSTTSLPSTSTTVTVTTTLPPCDTLCGNGSVDPQCDEDCDGSARGALVGDACPICEQCRCVTTTTIDCVVERRCGDGITQPECGEQCDVGSAESAFVSDACPSCQHCQCVTTSTTVTTTSTSTTIPGDCPERCGNGSIDDACHEECDGSARGALVGTCDACVACKCVTTTTLPTGAEICGNCIDDDHNGLTDFEDPACCSQTQAFSMELKRGRLIPKGSATKLRLKAFLARNGMDINPKSQDVEIQISGKAGEMLCAQIPASAFKQKKTTFKFKDKKHLVPSASAIDRVVIRVKKNHTVTFRLKGRKVALTTPTAGSLRVTVGFRDPTTAEAGNRCSSVRSAEFRTGPKGSIRFP